MKQTSITAIICQNLTNATLCPKKEGNTQKSSEKKKNAQKHDLERFPTQGGQSESIFHWQERQGNNSTHTKIVSQQGQEKITDGIESAVTVEHQKLALLKALTDPAMMHVSKAVIFETTNSMEWKEQVSVEEALCEIQMFWL